MPETLYKTRLTEWLKDLKKSRSRRVKWDEVVEGTGVAYSTLQKHRNHEFADPNFVIAAKIVSWFNDVLGKDYTPGDYYIPVEEEEPGQEPAYATSAA